MAAKLAEWLPQFEQFLRADALMAVQIFLVLGGYLTAKSLAGAEPISQFEFFSKLAARYQRLVIPLLAALSVAVAVTALVRPYFNHSSLSEAPSWWQVGAHIFLLQDILNFEAFSAGVWYVAIDFQLFAMALSCAWLAQVWQSASEKGWVVRKTLGLWLTLTLLSIFIWNLNPLLDIWGPYFFSAYGLGLCVGAWRKAGLKISLPQLGLLILMVGALAHFEHPRTRLMVAISTALVLCWYETKNGKPIEFLQLNWIRKLSSASYAIFLIHFSVSLVVSAVVFNDEPDNISINAVGLLISFALSIYLGHLLHQHVEKPPPTWKRWFQWGATFACTCGAVTLLTEL
jgi:peptidoglycan/LPS O-acetylase OafA/YrhL